MYSQDLRAATIAAYGVLCSVRKLAVILKISKSAIARWVKSGGAVKVRVVRPQVKLTCVVKCAIRLAIINNPFVTCAELAALLKQTASVIISRQLAAVAIRQIGFSRVRSRLRACPSPANLQSRIDAFKCGIQGVKMKDMLFIDEVGFRDTAAPLYGYTQTGQRLTVVTRSGGWKHTSVVAAINYKGRVMTSVGKGAFNTLQLLEYLKALPIRSGHVLIMDNVSFHKHTSIAAYLASKGARIVFTPPYSPDYNPIENMFSVVKSRYRKSRASHPNVSHLTHIKMAFQRLRSIVVSVVRHAVQSVWP